MRRKNTEPIKVLLRSYMREEGLETPLNEYRLIHHAWPEILGKGISTYTTRLYIYNQVLYVYLTSPVLRQELLMGREVLIRKLNQYVGAQVITNIVFR